MVTLVVAQPSCAIARLPTRCLGTVYAVQGPGALTSLVRVGPDGVATCDCAAFSASHLPCCHIASAARCAKALARQTPRV